MPDFAWETKLAGANQPVCGVDEAGRGPLAGPVVAAAVILDRRRARRGILAELDDSKKLSEEKRDQLFAALRAQAAAGHVLIGVGGASVADIARLNIFHATMLAMQRAVAALRVVPVHALIDGKHCPKTLPCPATAIVDGDALSLSIAAASVIAKVVRDRAMTKLHRRYPAYGWDRNKGYGTATHQAGLKRAGVTPHHRLGFAPVQAQMTLDLVCKELIT